MTLLLRSSKIIALGSAIAALSISAHANGGYLFDSGQPLGSSGTDLCDYTGDISCHEAHAATFGLVSAASISSVEAYLGMTISPANVLFQLREGSGNPLGVLESSGMVSVGSSAGWYGLTGLNQSVSAGNYTLFLLPQPDALGQAYLDAPNAPNPLFATWWSSDGTSWSQDQPTSNFGVRVGGIPTQVPAPLPILGAVAALGWSRKLRNRLRGAQPA